MADAKDYGFLPGNGGYENSLALQRAVDCGGDITVTVPGIYDLSEQINIGDDTAVYFGAGVIIRRQPSRSGKNGYAFINKGAFENTYNKNIKIVGLRIICNNVESTGFGAESAIIGVRAQLAFIWVKNLEIRSFACNGLLKKDYALQISGFENIIIEDVEIDGLKDGIHLGNGSKFVIRNGRFRTFDDPIALNAFDYSVSNPHVGWIENGLIENCYDLADSHTVGFFCRILGGCWLDWFSGMDVRHGDTVVNNGRIYRVVMDPTDGKVYKSVTAPVHTSGICEYDGIKWNMAQEGVLYNCGCRNLHFKDIFLEKKRSMAAFGIEYNNDTYAHSYYPGSTPVAQSGLIFENVHINDDVIPWFIRSTSPVANIRIINCDIPCGAVYLKNAEIEGMEYPETDILFSGTTFKENDACVVNSEEGCFARIKISAGIEEDGYVASVKGNVDVMSSDINIKHE